MRIQNNKLKTIDLFAGVGGIRAGFESNGFETVFSNDFEPKCKFTYDLNYGAGSMLIQDIKTIDPQDIPDFDFLLGGFPCQAFSIAGYRKGFEDTSGRGDLFFYVAKIIEQKRPKGFLLENVKNLVTHDSGRTFEIIKKTLRDLGYYIKYKVLNTMDYGNLLQNRERIYIVGFDDYNSYVNFEFPGPIKLTSKIDEVLEQKVDQKYFYNNKPLFDRLENDVVNPQSFYQWRRQYVRENKKGVCPTLTANMGTGGHNVPIIIEKNGIRKLTPRECFRLQGFPDTYQLPNIADSALYKQAGNSVSVSVIKRIAHNIKIAFDYKEEKPEKPKLFQLELERDPLFA
jgi:DNA (cytosine-5)-methyltransferase 1